MSSFLYFILPALGGYTLTSLYLLKNPHILHRKKRTAFYCTHISHRGGKSAVEQGTEMLELDCHLTNDGHVVVSHDENLRRQTGHDVTVSSLNLQDLPLYKERLEVTFYSGRFSSGADRRFALLEDVFRKFPEIPVSIEVKENNHQLIEKNDSMPYSFTMSRGLVLLLLYYSGLLPFVPLGESLLQFYLIRIFNRSDCRSVCRCIVTMRKSLFKHLAARGIQVHLFVCNKDEDIKAAFELGATGVMSDYPSLLSSYLSRNRMQD
uniref:Glycerophosphodiester phosphodiesterase domain containing 3a n=1 Tax=Acanthochromis polyacanthus TaxID=80966 RepID=A0A3Q1G2K3_9TELE